MRTPKLHNKVFLAAIREKSLRGVALSCDAHVMSASSGKIRQPCTVSLGDPVSCGTFLIEQHFSEEKLEDSKITTQAHLRLGSLSALTVYTLPAIHTRVVSRWRE